MKAKILITSFLFVSLVLFSCKKEEKEPEVNQNNTEQNICLSEIDPSSSQITYENPNIWCEVNGVEGTIENDTLKPQKFSIRVGQKQIVYGHTSYPYTMGTNEFLCDEIEVINGVEAGKILIFTKVTTQEVHYYVNDDNGKIRYYEFSK